MRQFTPCITNYILPIISELPVRQFTFMRSRVYSINFSELPVRQFTCRLC